MTLLQKIHEKILLMSSHEKRIRYLRRKGVKIGQDCLIHPLSFDSEPYLVEIGNKVRISGKTKFITHDGSIHCFQDEFEGDFYGKIKIGNNVFIGSDSIILLNTTIGDNCIIGAGSVVRGTFPENSIIMGNPAKVVYSTSIQKFLFRTSRGFVQSKNLSRLEKDKLIKKRFGIE